MTIVVTFKGSGSSRFMARFEDDSLEIYETGTTPEEAVGKLLIRSGHRKEISVKLPPWDKGPG